MTVYNKLKLAILAVLASQPLHAITIDPVQIQSAPGELLYAEINFRNADPRDNIQASLASAEDLSVIGVKHQPPGHLNFFTRKNARGEGVITITSSRPLTESELNLVVKIQHGQTSRLQHIRTSMAKSSNSAAPQLAARMNETPLKPMMIVSEKDIALNLPLSTQYNLATPKLTENLLATRQEAPPALATSNQPSMVMQTPAAAALQQERTAASTNPVQEQPSTNAEGTVVYAPTPKNQDPLVQKYAESLAAKAQEQAEQIPKLAAEANKAPAATTAKPTQHVVQSNESLWKIASRVAAQQKRPVSDVMQQIKRDNEHAFIQGDANRLRNGSTLKLDAPINDSKQQKRQVAELAKAPSTQSGKAKYKLNQAEMSLIAEAEQDSALGSAKKNTQSPKTSDELSLKVMTAREKTVKLQRNVTQLELALNQKDHKIQLLNARLAQLQQQLKAQQAAKKPTH
jgi:pilus assembly protein FimV